VPRNRTCREVAGIHHPSPPVLRAPPLRHRSSGSVEIAGDQPFDAPADEHTAIIAGRWLRRLRCALPEPLSE
jgi:hypothetical protein